ncbi:MULTISPECIES: polysaccharide deacetylase family protein [Fischerella]|uniref:Polysaccharide deacetylase n=1 Tax=Fischerella muscicola CCMEE 5323 TaxID=2019572 RepID=A0A2N6K2F8_FISMU|nr:MULTISPECIES: polysaccharide deacetylase family protein [Fischerella]MBD2429842.1 polysaccharide deacetylase family protein [Fischerella sp. FACHB-380]PLZ89231.1 polysaccharide deacetylase [Fischerella muscicola CCMEE 5323]
MTYSKTHPVVKPPKSKNLPLSLAVSFIIILFLLIFQDNATVIPILGFHGVINNKNSVIQLEQGKMHYPQKDLEKFLEYLLINDYWFLSSHDLYEILSNQNHRHSDFFVKKKPIMISFDDGYRTVYTNLLPILKRLEKKYGKKIKVVLFINPGTLYKKGSVNSTNLSCQELREGLQQGFYDIQSHGLNHKNLTRLSNKNLIKELLESQNELRKCTHDLDPQQKVASHFAYPYGAYNERVQKYVSKYYLSGYLYNNKILNRNFLKNQYEIPRLSVSRQESVKTLIEKFDTTFDEKSIFDQKVNQEKIKTEE